MRKIVILCSLFVLSLAPYAHSADQIGVIKSSEGAVSIVRDGNRMNGQAGSILFAEDILKTGSNGSVGVIMNDETSLSLGPSSELAFNEYLYNPKEHAFSVVLSFVKGTFAYMSGVIGKLAPESIRLETPDSTIAVRGTRLLIKVD